MYIVIIQMAVFLFLYNATFTHMFQHVTVSNYLTLKTTFRITADGCLSPIDSIICVD